MPEIITLDNNYSIKKLLTKILPVIVKNIDDKFETVLFLSKEGNRKGEGGLRTKGYFKNSYKKINGKWYIYNNETTGEEVKCIEWDKTDDLPLITVVTVVFNGEKYLRETIQSVIGQTYPNVEYIIIDGGSTDGTLNIIKKYEDKIDYWVSEKDKGIYDAMNKGIICSLGKWINFTNSSDIFSDNLTLSKIFFEDKGVYGNYEDIDLIYSDTILDGKFIQVCDIKSNVIIHQSLIYKKNIHHNVGLYLVGENLLLSDYIFFMLCKNKKWYKTIEIISNYSTKGISEKMFMLHFKQKIGVDLIFNNISRFRASLHLLIYPFYRSLKRVFKNIDILQSK